MYTFADLSDLQARLLGDGGLWHMLRKDLHQQLELPAHFDPVACPDLGCAPNLSVMIDAMSGLETMATLANIDGIVRMRDATESVTRFADRYFPLVNPSYSRGAGQSLIRLVWDAYRNGGLHKFFPKRDTITVGARQISITFTVGWLEHQSPKRSFSLAEVRRLRAADPTLSGTRPGHLVVIPNGPNAFAFFACVQATVLELVDAVGLWMDDLQTGSPFDQWFIDGANEFERGGLLNRHPQARACLTAMILEAQVGA
jgi:hypothetical protein